MLAIYDKYVITHVQDFAEDVLSGSEPFLYDDDLRSVHGSECYSWENKALSTYSFAESVFVDRLMKKPFVVIGTYISKTHRARKVIDAKWIPTDKSRDYKSSDADRQDELLRGGFTTYSDMSEKDIIELGIERLNRLELAAKKKGFKYFRFDGWYEGEKDGESLFVSKDEESSFSKELQEFALHWGYVFDQQEVVVRTDDNEYTFFDWKWKTIDDMTISRNDDAEKGKRRKDAESLSWIMARFRNQKSVRFFIRKYPWIKELIGQNPDGFSVPKRTFNPKLFGLRQVGGLLRTAFTFRNTVADSILRKYLGIMTPGRSRYLLQEDYKRYGKWQIRALGTDEVLIQNLPNAFCDAPIFTLAQILADKVNSVLVLETMNEFKESPGVILCREVIEGTEILGENQFLIEPPFSGLRDELRG